MLLPANCCDCVCIDNQLAEALGYRLRNSRLGEDPWCCLITLENHAAGRRTSFIPHLIERDSELDYLQTVYTRLGYGIASFAGDGSIVTVSPQLLSILKMEPSAELIEAFRKLIPSHFFKDIIWGMALTASNGLFENYRIRVHSPREKGLSILFNVSGYRGDNAFIHTLWQAISLTAGENDKLSEGSILNEARVHNITRKYVPQLVENKAREAVRLGYTELTNEEQLIAVLFCDIVGFTSYVENNEGAESIINTLNSILRRVSSSVKRYGGSIDKFMGDCVMALFANPSDAIMAALAMQCHAVDMNDLRQRAGLDSLRFRIGINWGTVIVGNLGTAERLDWTAIGDVVNTVSRIEKSCKPGAVLISRTVRDAVAEAGLTGIVFGETFYIRAKGKRDKLAVCYVDYGDTRGKKRKRT